jgi:hypothetical protein
MNWRYTGLSVLLLICFLIPWLFRKLSNLNGLYSSSSLSSALTAEEYFATVSRLPLNCIDLYSLGLIPHVSYKVKQSIWLKSLTISADDAADEERLNLWLIEIKGVGTKTAKIISSYLGPATPNPCPPV